MATWDAIGIAFQLASFDGFLWVNEDIPACGFHSISRWEEEEEVEEGHEAEILDVSTANNLDVTFVKFFLLLWWFFRCPNVAIVLSHHMPSRTRLSQNNLVPLRNLLLLGIF